MYQQNENRRFVIMAFVAVIAMGLTIWISTYLWHHTYWQPYTATVLEKTYEPEHYVHSSHTTTDKNGNTTYHDDSYWVSATYTLIVREDHCEYDNVFSNTVSQEVWATTNKGDHVTLYRLSWKHPDEPPVEK